MYFKSMSNWWDIFLHITSHWRCLWGSFVHDFPPRQASPNMFLSSCGVLNLRLLSALLLISKRNKWSPKWSICDSGGRSATTHFEVPGPYSGWSTQLLTEGGLCVSDFCNCEIPALYSTWNKFISANEYTVVLVWKNYAGGLKDSSFY